MIFELLHTNEPGHICPHLLYSFKIEEQKKNGYAKIRIIKAQKIKEGKYTSSDEDYVMEELARYSQKNKKPQSSHSYSNNVSSSSAGPLKKDGTPDMRYKTNRNSGYNMDGSSDMRYSSSMFSGPLKKDGTPDMRYKSNWK